MCLSAVLFQQTGPYRGPEKLWVQYSTCFLQRLWETKSRLFCYQPSDQNWNRKSNYWRDCPTGIEKLSAWGLGLGDTYGPMHYPGMRSLWQSPANFHQHLAFPSPVPATRPSYLEPFFLASSLIRPCSAPIVPGCWPLPARKEEIRSVQRVWRKVGGAQSLCIVSRGEMSQTLRCRFMQNCEKSPKSKTHRLTVCLMLRKSTSRWRTLWAKRRGERAEFRSVEKWEENNWRYV